MSVHINLTLIKVTHGPRGAKIGVGVYRKNPDGTQTRLSIGGKEVDVSQMREGETFVVNLPEEGDAK